jgi:hypothetical protein
LSEANQGHTHHQIYRDCLGRNLDRDLLFRESGDFYDLCFVRVCVSWCRGRGRRVGLKGMMGPEGECIFVSCGMGVYSGLMVSHPIFLDSVTDAIELMDGQFFW